MPVAPPPAKTRPRLNACLYQLHLQLNSGKWRKRNLITLPFATPTRFLLQENNNPFHYVAVKINRYSSEFSGKSLLNAGIQIEFNSFPPRTELQLKLPLFSTLYYSYHHTDHPPAARTHTSMIKVFLPTCLCVSL